MLNSDTQEASAKTEICTENMEISTNYLVQCVVNRSGAIENC